ncbi:MAG: bifunctional 5,10-methylenetetrahydrofolate dehydrogenase/5,10-methenyltetrahydrofolate cyclohydrolase [Christensenellaceae bacterium]
MQEKLILDGRKIAGELENNLRIRTDKLFHEKGLRPVLATILVGENPASVTYVRMKGNACKRTGLIPRKIVLPKETTTMELLEEIAKLNEDDSVYGILLQHPVPAHIDEQACFNAIDIKKDVDGVNTDSFGRMAMGLPAHFPATPFAILSILDYYNLEVAKKEVVVIGRSPILGKPVAMMLLNKDATVTICHSKTENLPDVVRRADIVVAAVGKPNFVQKEWLKDGVILIDAGYNKGNIGDIDMDRAKESAAAYTPVPGGVGPVTIAKLMEQTVLAAERN